MQESNKPQAEEQELIQVSGETNELTTAKDGDEAASQSEMTPSLEQLLKEAELRAAEHHDAWLRAKAEADNIRKRAQSDIANAHKYAIEKFSSELLAVMDSLEAALAVENATLENFKNGVELTHKQLVAVFEKFNIKVINPVGEKFDPHLHQAMCMVESELAPNTVTQVLQRGYLLHDRVIRPAMVAVAKAKDA
ncbi:MAG TPA: nucleotide exchange factor GrpE [Nitrosomonas nitrosa]|jgi:molecular chaperone GrpE|uniref:Protein GrpE n=1 Tax=Nitrosomonas nitrosa TaxID=52442 RepID=A0A1I4LQI0_9PROT|nr:nucleotide exchange factor GrpE [Nitrosomonas nitrosa]MCO6433373.1 nucleotide exchange factor GrpE [Nitrosomonas nitrosa]PTQ89263.1 molecular chaperone GrpE [Nitrosomonas nitrosa]CAE6485298.1 Protein GrpE [Nitrosomonas nitrosa]SFL93230.1 molecular chaperone GrpE [Nitrosomonas nitrosa]HBZ31234.1 nucleotide exchange factor GrpE [Nitrosomonas nitrosa]